MTLVATSAGVIMFAPQSIRTDNKKEGAPAEDSSPLTLK